MTSIGSLIGVALNDSSEGYVEVMVGGRISKNIAGEGIRIGDLVSTDSEGKMIKSSSSPTPKKKERKKMKGKFRPPSKKVWDPTVISGNLGAKLIYDEIKMVGVTFPCNVDSNFKRSEIIKDFLYSDQRCWDEHIRFPIHKNNLMKIIIEEYEKRRKHITLVREPNNQYDHNAVSVRVKVEGGLVYNTKKFYDVGYIPSYISKEVKGMSMYLTSAVEDGKGMVVGVFFSQLPFGQPVKVPKQIIRKPFKPLSLAQIRRKFGE